MGPTKPTSKQPVTLRIAPPVLAMVDELQQWIDAPSKNWIWETAIIRWHAEEESKHKPPTTDDVDTSVQKTGASPGD